MKKNEKVEKMNKKRKQKNKLLTLPSIFIVKIKNNFLNFPPEIFC